MPSASASAPAPKRTNVPPCSTVWWIARSPAPGAGELAVGPGLDALEVGLERESAVAAAVMSTGVGQFPGVVDQGVERRLLGRDRLDRRRVEIEGKESSGTSSRRLTFTTSDRNS